MPIRRRYNRRKRRTVVRPRRRYYAKRRGGRKMRASISRVPGISLPDRMFVKMAFSYMSTFSYTASGALQSVNFSGNNINDPANAQSILRPSGYTQWSALYDVFRVYSSNITCKFMSAQDPTLPSAIRVAVIPYDSGLNPTASNFNDVISQKYVKFRVYNATTSFPTIRHSMGVAKINGLNKESVRDTQDFARAFSAVPAGPADGMNWYIYAQPLAATTMTVNVQVRIIYNVELFQRKELLQP